MKDFNPVQGKTLSSRIVTQVRDALFSGELKPGEKLGSEAKLAEKFDVSRISVRDALRSLEAMGIVEIRMGAGGGARIAHGNSNRFADALAIQMALIGVETDDVLQVQGAIESLAAELAARNGTPEDLKILRENVEEAAKATADLDQTGELSRAFHLAVAEASHNEVLLALLRAIRYVFWYPGVRPGNRKIARSILAAHEVIAAMIEQGDAEGARNAMRGHVQHLQEKSAEHVARQYGQRSQAHFRGEGV